MEFRSEIIVSADDITAYLNIIRLIEPQSILDVGMFLKRIGAVSRRNRNVEIASTARLDGVDFMDNLKLPVMNVIYDNVFPLQQFINSVRAGEQLTTHYELAILLYPDCRLSCEEERELWRYLSDKCDFIFTNILPKEERTERIVVPDNLRDAKQFAGRYALYEM